MVESSPYPQEEPAKKNPDLARTASDMFIRVSMNQSASVIRQAALISMECQQKGLDPKQLEYALINDADQITRIRKAAERAHKRSEKQISVPSEEAVKDIIQGDFRWGNDLIKVPESDLQKIIDHSPRFKKFLDPETETRLYANRIRKRYSREKREGKIFDRVV